MSCQPIELAGTLALRVSVIVRNDSQVALLFLSDVPQKLLVGQADITAWRRARERGQPVRWEDIEPIRWGLNVPEGEILDPPQGTAHRPWWRRRPSRGWLLDHLSGEKLEPGEQWARSALIPVPTDNVAYLLRAEICACRHVAVRHILWHRVYCSNNEEPRLTWSREIYAFPREFDNNGERREPRNAGTAWSQIRSRALSKVWHARPTDV